MIIGELKVDIDTGRGMYFEGEEVKFDGTAFDLEEAIAEKKIEILFPNSAVLTLEPKELDFGPAFR